MFLEFLGIVCMYVCMGGPPCHVRKGGPERPPSQAPALFKAGCSVPHPSLSRLLLPPASVLYGSVQLPPPSPPPSPRRPHPPRPPSPSSLPVRRRYQHFLESVLEGADEYQEVPDLLMRHATLRATNKDLRDHQHKCRCGCRGAAGWRGGWGWGQPARGGGASGLGCQTPPTQPQTPLMTTPKPTNRARSGHPDPCPHPTPRSELAETIRAELASYVKGRTDEILNLNNQVARLKKELERHEAEAMLQVRCLPACV